MNARRRPRGTQSLDPRATMGTDRPRSFCSCYDPANPRGQGDRAGVAANWDRRIEPPPRAAFDASRL